MYPFGILSPCVLAACPPAERGGVHLWSAGARGLSLHLQHERSEESLT